MTASIAFLPPPGHKARPLAIFLLTLLPILIGGLFFSRSTGTADPKVFDWPYYLLAQIFSVRGARLFLSFLFGLNFVPLFFLAHAALRIPKPRQKVWVSAGLAVLGLLSCTHYRLDGNHSYAYVASLGFLSSALLLMRFWADKFAVLPLRQSLKYALLAGVPSGLAGGIDFLYLFFGLCLAAALLFVTGDWRQRIGFFFFFALGCLIGFGLVFAFGFLVWSDEFHFWLFSVLEDGPVIPPSLSSTFYLPLLFVFLPFAVLLRLLFGRNRVAEDRFSDYVPTRLLLWTSLFAYLGYGAASVTTPSLAPIELLAPLLFVLTIGLLPLRSPARVMLTAFVLLALTLSLQPGVGL